MTLNQRLHNQIRHAYDNAPATKARFEAAGLTPDDIQTVGDLAKLAILPKDEIVQMQQDTPPFGGLLAVPMAQVSHIFFSPGPLYEPDSEGNLDDHDAWGGGLVEAGFSAEDIVLNTLSYHLVPAGLMVDQALVRAGCTVVPGGVGNSDLQVKMMHDLGVTAYAGTPSFLAILLEKADAAGLELKLNKAFVSAEPLPPSLRQSFAERGIAVTNAYGTAELGILAYDNVGSMAMKLMPEPIIEIVDPETGQCVGAGEAGEVVVTNFNRTYPLIRFGTGDMAVNIDPAPGESKQQERALTLVGRSGEAVKVRGMFVHPNQLRFAAGRVLKFTGIQGVVTRPEQRDYFVVKVISAETDKTTALMQALHQICRVKIDQIEFVESLEDGARGMIDAREWT
ncbi:MAG TPA: phenylacetate--CoA ligase family protein [Anaerolineae bacterium]|nr:phenylacetate--CoA ligase family protein [Anaerolineae bacterium]